MDAQINGQKNSVAIESVKALTLQFQQSLDLNAAGYCHQTVYKAMPGMDASAPHELQKVYFQEFWQLNSSRVDSYCRNTETIWRSHQRLSKMGPSDSCKVVHRTPYHKLWVLSQEWLLYLYHVIQRCLLYFESKYLILAYHHVVLTYRCLLHLCLLWALVGSGL